MKTIISENLKNTQRYIPHTLETRLAAVKTYRNNNSIHFICRRYKVFKASLMRWNKDHPFSGVVFSVGITLCY